jgi:hypothetical protein
MPHAPLHQKQKTKNIAVAVLLLVMMGLLFAVTLVRVKIS